MNAAILFEPDGYLLDRPKLMGRQSAGNGFLRAAIAANPDGRLSAYTPSEESFAAFRQAVRGQDPSVETRWIPSARLDLLAHAGILYRPDSALPVSASARLREGPAAYSLCGVTHTLCSEGALRHAFDMLTVPIMPWDALICTSQAALTLVREMLAQHVDFLGWQLGQPVRAPDLQLPVIPLGVHAADFDATPEDRAAARARLGIADDEIVALFAGRLSFSGKAHPVSMMRGLQAAAERTRRKIVLIQAGSFFNDKIADLYRAAAARFCPDVRAVFVEGRAMDDYAASWRAADLFISMADSIQETFGLTPIEAMAAGLPVIVSDWNGYKDTVRDGIDGFRVRSWAPSHAADDAISRKFETRDGNFDLFLVRVGGAASVDQRQLDDRLCTLVEDAELRARMGAAGRRRVLDQYEWAGIYAQYRELWAELGRIRANHLRNPDWTARLAAAPRSHSLWPDPYRLFAHYPTQHVTAKTRFVVLPNADFDDYRDLAANPLFAMSGAPSDLAALLLATSSAPVSLRDVARSSGQSEPRLIDAAARLAKMGLIAFTPD